MAKNTFSKIFSLTLHRDFIDDTLSQYLETNRRIIAMPIFISTASQNKFDINGSER